VRHAASWVGRSLVGTTTITDASPLGPELCTAADCHSDRKAPGFSPLLRTAR
jgi:hypothetical protein